RFLVLIPHSSSTTPTQSSSFIFFPIPPPPISTLFPYTTLFRSENLPRFAWSTPQRQKLKFLPHRRYNLTLNLLSRSHDGIASGRQIAINGHIKFNLTISLMRLSICLWKPSIGD